VPAVLDFSRYNFSAWVEQLKPVFANLQIGGVRGLRLSSQPLDYTVWISEDKSYIATIPPHLRKCLFTRMFFLNGAGLKYFKLVYMNPEVKIFRVEPVALENVTSL